MDCDLLIAWMSHTGEGSWARFRNAVEEAAGNEADLSALCRRLRIDLSDLGFAEFFIADTQQWRMLPPLLGGTFSQDRAAVLCGARTPCLVESLKKIAELHRCKIFLEQPQNCPTLIRVAGGTEQLAKVARQIGAAFEPNLSLMLIAELMPIADQLDVAPQEVPPLNWKVRSFDFRIRTWVDELLPNSHCEYIPTYGRSRFFVHRKRGTLQRLPKRESLYAAAMLNGVSLVEYDVSARQLQVPLFAPLPLLFSRATILCSGRPAEVLHGRIIYSDVPPEIAAVVMVAAGQPHPSAESLTRVRK